jgi:hypothetical protein
MKTCNDQNIIKSCDDAKIMVFFAFMVIISVTLLNLKPILTESQFVNVGAIFLMSTIFKIKFYMKLKTCSKITRISLFFCFDIIYISLTLFLCTTMNDLVVPGLLGSVLISVLACMFYGNIILDPKTENTIEGNLLSRQLSGILQKFKGYIDQLAQAVVLKQLEVHITEKTEKSIKATESTENELINGRTESSKADTEIVIPESASKQIKNNAANPISKAQDKIDVLKWCKNYEYNARIYLIKGYSNASEKGRSCIYTDSTKNEPLKSDIRNHGMGFLLSLAVLNKMDYKNNTDPFHSLAELHERFPFWGKYEINNLSTALIRLKEDLAKCGFGNLIRKKDNDKFMLSIPPNMIICDIDFLNQFKAKIPEELFNVLLEDTFSEKNSD